MSELHEAYHYAGGAQELAMIWAFLPAKGFPYAVMPTHTIQMEYDLGPNHSYSHIIEVAPSGAKKLASEVRDPLLSQIKALLAKHDRINADKAYEKATGADLTTADSVMDAIQNPNN